MASRFFSMQKSSLACWCFLLFVHSFLDDTAKLEDRSTNRHMHLIYDLVPFFLGDISITDAIV